MTNLHHFHIPVMGVGFTIDTPIKVAHLGITSVISIGDDLLCERLRVYYSEKFGKKYQPISTSENDSRAKRITAYLDLVYEIVQEKFKALQNQAVQVGSELNKYFELLPNDSSLKQDFSTLKEGDFLPDSIKSEMKTGEIEVNIMTKLDRQHYDKAGKPLDRIYNDAHAAMRGYANSKLTSGIVLSAGLNPGLYSYTSQFPNFFPDENDFLDKKIILKVSDYRSALVQGKFLAKKGVWVSEYRIESGLNCGGHAFVTDGLLAGPIMAEFKAHRQELINEVHAVLVESLERSQKHIPVSALPLNVTYQGGVGTHAEHDFIRNHFGMDSIGWATPFLLVPEAVNVDQETQSILAQAGENELYLSSISPIGVPFNTVKGNTKDQIKDAKILQGDPGSTCPRQYLKLFNTEFTKQPVCLSSKQYQTLKLKELDQLNLSEEEYQKAYNKITEKACLCTGLVITAYMAYGLVTKPDGQGVSVCPGPNLAYFSKISSLREMVDHIYGRTNLLNDTPRPNVFVKELGMYMDVFMKEIQQLNPTPKSIKRLQQFKENLLNGLSYYQSLFSSEFKDSQALSLVNAYQNTLQKASLPSLPIQA